MHDFTIFSKDEKKNIVIRRRNVLFCKLIFYKIFVCHLFLHFIILQQCCYPSIIKRESMQNLFKDTSMMMIILHCCCHLSVDIFIFYANKISYMHMWANQVNKCALFFHYLILYFSSEAIIWNLQQRRIMLSSCIIINLIKHTHVMFLICKCKRNCFFWRITRKY